MERHRIRFKNCVAQAFAQVSGASFRAFREQRDYDEFLESVFCESRDPAEVAALALSGLCIGDAQAMDRIVMLATVQFVNETAGTSSTDPTIVGCFRDLAEIFPGEYQQYLNWARAWCR